MMRTTLALCAVVLSGCSSTVVGQTRPGDARPAGDGGPDECLVKVFVRKSPGAGDTRILVNNEPVYPHGSCSTGVTWRLMTPGYTFDPAKGILFAVPPLPSCGPSGAEFSCTSFNYPRSSKKIPYSITVLGPGGPYTLDPSVIID